jgi:hypothetical protein
MSSTQHPAEDTATTLPPSSDPNNTVTTTTNPTIACNVPASEPAAEPAAESPQPPTDSQSTAPSSSSLNPTTSDSTSTNIQQQTPNESGTQEPPTAPDPGTTETTSTSDGSFAVSGFATKEHLARWLPQIDDKNSWRIWLSKRSIVLALYTMLAGVILISNLGFTLWGVKHYPSPHGIGIIYQGNCALVKRLNLWLHLLINFMGTAMLMASNYCMQIQGSPTRKDVDRAHARGHWVDIGVPSLRNLQWVGNWKRFSWMLLCLSSLPVHLMQVYLPAFA